MKRITIGIHEKFLNCDLEEFIAHLTTIKEQIQHDYGVKANIEIDAFEGCDEAPYIIFKAAFNRDETEAEKQAKLDDERLRHRKKVQHEIETLQKLTEKYANFNGDFENYYD